MQTYLVLLHEGTAAQPVMSPEEMQAVIALQPGNVRQRKPLQGLALRHDEATIGYRLGSGPRHAGSGGRPSSAGRRSDRSARRDA